MARWIVAVAFFGAVSLGMGCGERGPTRSRGGAPRKLRSPSAGREVGAFVAIGGGRRLWAECSGSGRPTVVLEAGFGAGAFGWQSVQPQVSKTTRVCSYDRAGSGSSDPAPGVRDARDEVGDLRRLLDRLGATAPYVLVGHSYGGVLARAFAYLRPADTAGLVLIDTMGRDGRQRQLAIWPKATAPAIRRQLAATRMRGIDLGRGEALADRLRTLGATPLAIVTAGREDAFPRAPAWLHRKLLVLWVRMQDELAGLSHNRLHVVALGSDHDIPSAQTGQPSAVTRAIEAVVHAARDHTQLPPCRAVFTGPDVRCRG